MAQPESAPSSIAILNVTVISMEKEEALPGETVRVEGGRIVAVGPTATVAIAPSTVVVDGSGKFLIPGLADMHVHLQRETSLEANKWFINLLLTNGITTIRNMWGIPEHLELRRAIREGKMIGPTIYTAGPILDGRPPMWQGSVVVESAPEVEAALSQQQSAGYDFVKVYSQLSKDAYHAIFAGARARHLKVVGHVPLAVGIEEAIMAGQYSIEHLDGYINAIETADSPVFGKTDWYSQMVGYGYIDQQKLDHLANLTRDAGTWNCPTLVTMSKWLSPEERDKLRHQQGTQSVPDDVRKLWEIMSDRQLKSFSRLDMLKLRRAEKARSAIVRSLLQHGAKIVAGTDTPAPFVVPGVSLHEELAKLVAAGLSPYQALRAATRDAAELLGQLDEFGTIAPGKRADLVLLDADPLVRISNSTQIAGVMLQGRWFSRATLDHLFANEFGRVPSPELDGASSVIFKRPGYQYVHWNDPRSDGFVENTTLPDSVARQPR